MAADRNTWFTAAVEHGKMAYGKWGLGRPYLLLTASPFGGKEFREVGEILSISAMSVAPDLPGIGESDPIPEPGPAEVCDALLSLFAAVGLDTIVVAASGIASLAAFELVDRHPSCVAGLALLNPVLSESQSSCMPPYLRRRNTTAIDILGFAQRKSMADVEKMFIHPETIGSDARKTAEESLARTGRKRMQAYYSPVKAGRFNQYMESLRRFKKPVHVLRGDHDFLGVPGLSDAFTKEVPNARTHVITDAGHFMAIESPSRLADALVEIGRRAW